jgi:hypothetical protein
MDMNASDKYGRTRLHRTIESRSAIEINDQRAIETLVAEVNTLLNDGANVNTTTNTERDEMTPLAFSRRFSVSPMESIMISSEGLPCKQLMNIDLDDNNFQ